METWRRLTASVESLSVWEKTIPGTHHIPSLFMRCVFIINVVNERDSVLCFRALLEQVEHWQSFLALVNMIMFCTGIPGHYPVNETTSSLTLTFWYTLQVSVSADVISERSAFGAGVF